jgi:hypothetical protein
MPRQVVDWVVVRELRWMTWLHSLVAFLCGFCLSSNSSTFDEESDGESVVSLRGDQRGRGTLEEPSRAIPSSRRWRIYWRIACRRTWRRDSASVTRTNSKVWEPVESGFLPVIGTASALVGAMEEERLFRIGSSASTLSVRLDEVGRASFSMVPSSVLAGTSVNPRGSPSASGGEPTSGKGKAAFHAR